MKSRKRRGDSEWDAWQRKVVWCGSGKMGAGPWELSGWILVTPRPPHAPSTVLNCRPLELSAKQGQCLKCIPETVEAQVSECSQVRVHPERGLFQTPASSLPSGSVEGRTARMDPSSRAAVEPDAVLKNWLGVALLRLPEVQTYFKLETVIPVVRICMVGHCTQSHFILMIQFE